MTTRTQVAIIGAGPAGLVLALLLQRAGIQSVILELHDRDYIEQRVRAGLLEHGTVELLSELGAGERLRRRAFQHDSFEVRFLGRRYHIPMRELTGGRTAWMYPQQEVVKDLVAVRLENGEPLLFEATDIELEDIDSDRPKVHYRHDGGEHTLECDVIAGCDGFHGVCRPSVPEGVLTFYEREYPFAWLGILAEAPPATTEELIYAHHPNGFALHSFRSTEVSRMYLQVEPDEDLSKWPDERIWQELRTRFATDDDWTLGEGPITQKNVTAMRSFVTEPMQYGNLFLAGDAAHIVPPTAAKGLNLAVADVVLLADALIAYLGSGDRRALDGYSETALRRVWLVQEFSSEMTTMFHHRPADAFGARIQQAALERVCTSPSYMTAFCEVYTGLPFHGRVGAAAATAGGIH